MTTPKHHNSRKWRNYD